jgi:chemotaxis protein MotA
MDLGSIIGVIATIAIILATLIIEGGSPAELIAHPQAILLTFLGSLMAAGVSAPFSTLLATPKLFLLSIQGNKFDRNEVIDTLIEMAGKARRDGLLALEEEIKNIEDDFLKKGLMLVVDGVDQAQVKSILHTEIVQMKERHALGANMINGAGGYAPTFGIIGTVMGLIGVLQKLDEPSTLGHSIAAAFLATLWGLLSANVFFLPLGGKLVTKTEEEVAYREMLIEGILGIQAGENPRMLREKLNSYLPPKSRQSDDEV